MSEVPHYDGQKLDTADQKRLLRRLKKGDNPSIIANDFGISRRMVNYYRQRFNLKARTRGKPPHKFRFKGRTQTLKEWGEELDIPYSTLSTRVAENWTVKEMFTIPRGHCRPQYNIVEPMLSDETVMQVWLEQQAGATLRELTKKYKVGKPHLARRLQDVRGITQNLKWREDDPRKPAQVLVSSLTAFLRSKRLLTQFKRFHLKSLKNGRPAR